MKIKKQEFTLYGLDNHKKLIDKIISDLKNLGKDIDNFDIKLILTEALTNAFKHGNKGNMDKPIFLRYSYDNSLIMFEIEHSAKESIDVTIPDQIVYENILTERGRGLFLIKCIADEVEVKSNILIIKKYFAQQIA